MAISVPQTFATQGFSGNSKSFTLSTPPTAGYSIIALVQMTSNAAAPPTVTDSAGNAYDLVQAVFSGSAVAQLLAQDVSPGTGTFSIDYQAPAGIGLLSLGVVYVAGIGAGQMLVVDELTSGGSTSGATSLALTEPAQNLAASELVVALLGTQTTGPIGISDPITGYTRVFFYDNAGQAGGSAAYKITAALETSSASWSWTTSAKVGGSLATYRLVNLLAGTVVARNSGAAALATSVPLAASGRAVSFARGFPGRALAGGGRAAVSSTAAMSTGARAAAVAAARYAAAGALINWASVVLTAPLYTGRGSIFGAHADWSNGAPGVGATVYYDPTNMSVLANGEIVATASDFKAQAEWIPSAGVSSRLTVQVTSGFASWSQNGSSGAASQSVSIPLRSVASAISAAVAHFAGGAQFTAVGAARWSANAPLSSAISLISAGHSRSAGRGTPNTLVALASAASSRSRSIAGLGTEISLAATSHGVSLSVAAPHTAIALHAATHTISHAGADLRFPVTFSSNGRSVAVAGFSLLTHIALTSRSSSRSSSGGHLGFGASLSSRSTSRSFADPSLTTAIRFGSASAFGCFASLLTPTLVRYGYAEISVEPQLVGPQAPPGPEVTIIEESACFVTASWFGADGNPYEPLSLADRIDDTLSGEAI
ncbi:MAG: hypothetical protein ACYDAE_17295, partial [Steroidobacteraceae bacterium]